MERTKAIVLRRVRYGEADVVATFFSREHGRMSGLARNARKSIKRFGAALEPGCVAELMCRKGRGDLLNIEEARVLSGVCGITRSLVRVEAMTRAIELALKFLQEMQAAPEKFDLLERFLALLGKKDPSAADVAKFELEFISHSGFAPSVGSCAACGTGLSSGKSFVFDMEEGGLFCGCCRSEGGFSFRMGRAALSGFAYLCGNGGDVDGANAAASVVDRYITHILGKPLVCPQAFAENG